MGVKSEYPLSLKEFKEIYSKVPRLNVEIILHSDKGVVLTLRAIEPCAGKWHLPGGAVWYGELFADAIKRIAKKELGITVTSYKMIGFIEYPDHIESGYGDPRGIAFLVEEYTGGLSTDEEADSYKWFTRVPDNIHPHQDTFLLDHGLLSR